MRFRSPEKAKELLFTRDFDSCFSTIKVNCTFHEATMYIKSITLQGFKSYREQLTAEFS